MDYDQHSANIAEHRAAIAKLRRGLTVMLWMLGLFLVGFLVLLFL